MELPVTTAFKVREAAAGRAAGSDGPVTDMDDPTGALARMRDIVGADLDGEPIDLVEVVELIDLVASLDKHLSEGGRLPAQWAANRP
jgi:hypothetical protein